jgi:SET domain-containing protein
MLSRTMSPRTVRVARSATGLGLFAVKPIAKRAYIVAYQGKRIPTKEAHRREREGNARYMFEINDRWTIDGSSRRNLGRYANHACRPNCEPVLRKGKIVLIALRDIAPGEEIAYDYGKDYFDLFIAPLGCRCMACARKAAKIYGKTPRRGTPAKRR